MENKPENIAALRVLIIDDHKMVRDGLKVMLASLNKSMRFKVVEAESGEEALVKISRSPVEVVIVDYQLPGISGPETILRILRFRPGTKILALSNYDEVSYIQSMLAAGARGYVLKNIEPAELLRAVRMILAGGCYYCSEVAVKLIEEDKNPLATQRNKILTPREEEVLQLIAGEMTNEEIARKLFVAKRTVDTHRQNLLNKLDVKNTAGLVNAAHKMNLVEKQIP